MGRYRSVSVNIDVDVDMRDFETGDLVEELAERWTKLNEEQKKRVNPYYIDGWEPENLDHKMKFELFLNHIDDYFYTEFEKRISGAPEDWVEKSWDGHIYFIPVIKL